MKQAKTVFIEELKNSLFSKKIIFVIIILSFIMMTVYASGFLQIAYLLLFKPSSMAAFPISISYYLLFITIPLFALLLGHDAVSSEIENLTIRGVISKISRNSFITGKFLSLWASISSLSFIVLFSSAAYTYAKTAELDIIHPFVFLLYLLLYIAAVSAAIIFCSSIFSRSSTSLFFIIFVYTLLAYLSLNNAGSISIFSYIGNIVSLDNLIAPIAAFVLYTIIFLSSSLLIFSRRDL